MVKLVATINDRTYIDAQEQVDIPPPMLTTGLTVSVIAGWSISQYITSFYFYSVSRTQCSSSDSSGSSRSKYNTDLSP